MGTGKQDAAFIRVISGGTLEWGVPNHQQGGGMEVYSVSQQGNGELTGTKELRGFEVALPPGFELPVMHVTLSPRGGGSADADPAGAR